MWSQTLLGLLYGIFPPETRVRWDLYTPAQRRQAAIDALPQKIAEIDVRVERLHADLEAAQASIQRTLAAPGAEMTKRMRLAGAVRERNGILTNIQTLTSAREMLRSTAASYENVALLKDTRRYIDTILRTAGGEDVADDIAQTAEDVQDADREVHRLQTVIQSAMQPLSAPVSLAGDASVDEEVSRLLAAAPAAETAPTARSARDAVRKIRVPLKN